LFFTQHPLRRTLQGSELYSAKERFVKKSPRKWRLFYKVLRIYEKAKVL
jgi:hypothetical protein